MHYAINGPTVLACNLHTHRVPMYVIEPRNDGFSSQNCSSFDITSCPHLPNINHIVLCSLGEASGHDAVLYYNILHITYEDRKIHNTENKKVSRGAIKILFCAINHSKIVRCDTTTHLHQLMKMRKWINTMTTIGNYYNYTDTIW